MRAFRRMFHVKHRFVRVLLSAVVVSNEKEARRIIAGLFASQWWAMRGFEPRPCPCKGTCAPAALNRPVFVRAASNSILA